MNRKIKLLAISCFLALIFAILALSPSVSVNADKADVVKEIENYKAWTKINDEPIRVELNIDFSGG